MCAFVITPVKSSARFFPVFRFIIRLFLPPTPSSVSRSSTRGKSTFGSLRAFEFIYLNTFIIFFFMHRITHVNYATRIDSVYLGSSRFVPRLKSSTSEQLNFTVHSNRPLPPRESFIESRLPSNLVSGESSSESLPLALPVRPYPSPLPPLRTRPIVGRTRNSNC